jgi:hypothetical protein
MKLKMGIMTGLIVLLILAASAMPSQAAEKIPPDERAVKLLNDFMAALAIPDSEAREQAVVPLVHKSLLTADGKRLDDNTRPFSYKKACQNAKFYQHPVKIKYVLKGGVYTIGFGDTAERGRTDRYFLEKKEGVAGMPAPILVFWPDSGGDPKITNMGSL